MAAIKVYLVEAMDYDDAHTIGVFSTLEKAMAIDPPQEWEQHGAYWWSNNKCNDAKRVIIEWPVDEYGS